LNLKATVCSDNYAKAKLAFAAMKHGQGLKVVVDYEVAVTDLTKAMRSEEYKVLKQTRNNRNKLIL
jgi:TusA-related sulfurtransferase